MDLKLLRIFEMLFVALGGAIGGALLGFTFGMTNMYNKTMNGLGLIEGGTPSYLDVETLYHVQSLMSNIFPVSKANIFGVAGLVIIAGVILGGILAVFLIPIQNMRANRAH